MPRSKRGRSAPDYDSDHEDHLAASDDDDALMDDDHEEALTDDEEEEVFEECEEMDEDEDEDIDQCSKIGSRLPPRILLMPYYIMYDGSGRRAPTARIERGTLFHRPDTSCSTK